MDASSLDDLARLVGAAACKTDPADCEPFVTDYRKLYRGKALAVVTPHDTHEVSRVVRWCFEQGIGVVPQGGNTSLMGGAVPRADDGDVVVLNLGRMNRVLAIDVENDTMTVQAGVTLSAARAAAQAEGRLFPLRIGSEGTCQIGGNIATNAGGTAVLRYGNMRDLVLGVEAVLPDGRIYPGLRGLRKDNTGYDLKQLFIGSEGTLGIITGAVLKLMPAQRASTVAWIAVESPSAAVRLLGEARRLVGQDVTAFELVSDGALKLVCSYLGGASGPFTSVYPWMVLVEFTSSSDHEGLSRRMTDFLEHGLVNGLIQDAVVAASLKDAENLWRLREEISDAQTRTRGSVKCDVSVPLSAMGRFIDDASRAVHDITPEARLIIYGHIGDGNVHFNPLRPASQSAPDFLESHGEPIARRIDEIANSLNGSISAEHGIGVEKRDELQHYKSAVELDLMTSIKKCLDPRCILNPGKVLPPLSGWQGRHG